jgi:mannose-6-phosphate isomerase-like protein (cupin superfamily)
MSAAPRLIVAAREADGSSVVMSDQPVPPTVARAYPGVEFFLLWGTEDGGATVSAGPPRPTLLPFFAGPGGTRLMLTRYAPESAVAGAEGDPEDLAREVKEKLPGLAEVFESPDSGMHATDTVDYGICLEGELYLELDNGKEVLLTPGSCVVQLGTRHAWHNRGDKPALMCFVGIGARRDQ